MTSLIRSLGFDGYRSFPSRRQYDRSQPLQRLDLAPLTLLIGRNNSGKSSVVALLHQILGGLAAIDRSALPLVAGASPVAEGFQDLLHARNADSFLELDIALDTGTTRHRLNTILFLRSLKS
jgi:predicted ATPase